MGIKLGELIKICGIDCALCVYASNDIWYGSVEDFKKEIVNYEECEVKKISRFDEGCMNFIIEGVIEYRKYLKVSYIGDELYIETNINPRNDEKTFLVYLTKEFWGDCVVEKLSNGSIRVFNQCIMKSLIITKEDMIALEMYGRINRMEFKTTEWEIGEKVAYYYDEDGRSLYYPAWILRKGEDNEEYQIICPSLDDKPFYAYIGSIESALIL